MTILRNRLRQITDWTGIADSESGRLLMQIRQDMDLKDYLFRERRRNEEVLALKYEDNDPLGGKGKTKNLRENVLNLPYRQLRWFESQATSKKLVVKVARNAGPGQKPGGEGDETTGGWVGEALSRIAHEAGYKPETKALIGEMFARGTSVMRIGYHEQAITLGQAQEVGKSPQSVVVDAMQGESEAVEGQDHAAIAKSLGELAESEKFLLAAGTRGVDAVLARKDSEDVAAFKAETARTPTESTRMIRRRIWMMKLRVGEDVGWAPWVTNIEDTPFFWQRFTWTVAQVKKSPLFRAKFKKEVQGYDGRNVSGVFRGGETPSSESMGAEAKRAQTESLLSEDERFVEWFQVWFRAPDMRAGGYVKIVAPEMPDDWLETDDSNPHVSSVEEGGYGLIPGFFPFYPFTPILPTLMVPERTCGISQMSAAMPQFEKIAEYNRIRQEAALKAATRLFQIHPGLKDKAAVLAAINNGEVGYAFIADGAQVDESGKMQPAVLPIHFTGKDPEISRESAYEESSWIKMSGMPPSVLQGMGTAETATQDQMGVAAGERESMAIVSYIEERMADVLAGVRGLMRSNYDDEDFQKLLGAEGAAVLKKWQTGSVDDGDTIEVTCGAGAKAQEIVHIEQMLKGIQTVSAMVGPMGVPIVDTMPLIEELWRTWNLGKPKEQSDIVKQLQQLAGGLAQQIEQLTGVNPLQEKKQGGGGAQADLKRANPPSGGGPTPGNLNAGARRNTNEPAGMVPTGI